MYSAVENRRKSTLPRSCVSSIFGTNFVSLDFSSLPYLGNSPQISNLNVTLKKKKTRFPKPLLHGKEVVDNVLFEEYKLFIKIISFWKSDDKIADFTSFRYKIFRFQDEIKFIYSWDKKQDSLNCLHVVFSSKQIF